MSKRSRFRGPFDKQHGRPSQALLKSASQHFYLIHWALRIQLSWKNSLLLTWKILRLVVNTLAADEKYLVLTRENLTIPIQMQLSEKQKKFSEFFLHFWNSAQILNILEKNWPSQFLYFGNYWLQKKWLAKCLKGPVSEDPLISNMADLPNHCWNLHHSIFIWFIEHWGVNWVGKSLSYWHAKSWDWLLTNWLSMKSIFYFLERI